MTVTIDDGAIVIEKAGITRLNTNDKFFHGLSTLTGTVPIPAYSHPDGTNAALDQTFDLGAVNPLCADVLGAMKFFGYSYSAGVANSVWTTVMGGSVLWVMDGHALTGVSPDPNAGINQLCWFDLSLSGGHAYLIRRLRFNKSGQGTYTILGHSVQYKLRCGVWT